MKCTPLLLIGLMAGSLAAQADARPATGLSMRLQAGMLNPNDPFQVTMALGAAAGGYVRRFGLFLGGLRQSQNGNAGSDLTADARTFWGLGLEYSASARGLYARQPLVRLGVGRLNRARFRSTWYVQAGAGLRYRVAGKLAFVGAVEDYAAFLPDEPQRCEPLPGGLEHCLGPVDRQVQHNFGFIVTFEFVP